MRENLRSWKESTLITRVALAMPKLMSPCVRAQRDPPGPEGRTTSAQPAGLGSDEVDPERRRCDTVS